MPQISQFIIKLAFTLIISQAIFQVSEKQMNHFFVQAQFLNSGENSIDQQTEVKIMKPLIDTKSYRYIELDNKLKVVLIHDPNSEISSAALDVKVGSWNEPDQFPGLAHFLEHMLFGGSQKYSRLDYFDDLLAKGSGSSNAYTDSTNTNYYFDITSNLFGKAFDVFAHFFIDPLFNEELVQREISAVDSEYQIDVSSEEWKIQNLFSIFANKKHPASRFSIGNTEVLKKKGIQEALKKFFKENYSSNQMSLVVQSSLSFDQMEKIIHPFNKIQNLNTETLKFQQLPYEFGLICKYKSDRNQLTLNWQLQGREKYIHQKPVEFIDYIISNGNLQDFLKDNEYIVSLSSEVYSETEYQTNYMIQMELKENQKDLDINAAEITKIVHNYFQKIEEWLNDDEYLQQLFKDQKHISKLSFNYLDQSMDVSSLAQHLNLYPPQELITSNFIIETLDKELVFDYLQQFQNIENLILLVAQDNFEYVSIEEPQTNNKQFLKNKNLYHKSDLYRLVFSDQKFDEHFTKFITLKDEDLQTNFAKPEKNNYIPSNVEMISLCKTQSSSLPDIIHADKLKSLDEQSKLNLFLAAGQHLNQYSEDQCLDEEKVYQKINHYPILLNKEKQEWWKSATQYHIPFIFGALQISYPKQLSLKQFTSLKIYNVLIEELTEREMKLPISTGYDISFNLNKKSEIKLYGFSEHVRNLFKKLCSCLNPFRDKSKSFIELNEGKRFENAKEFLSTSIRKMYQEDLFEQALNIHLPSLLQKDFHNPQKVLSEIEKVSQQEMLQNVKEILGNSYSQSLFVGNLNQQEAQEVSEEVKQCTNSQKENQDTQQKQQKIGVINLSGQQLIYSKFIEQGNKDDINGVTLNYYQIGKRNNENYALMKLLEPVLNQQAFNYLRTELQLGYLVEVKFKTTQCIDGAVVLVQGSKEIPMKVNTIIEEFLEQFNTFLQQIDQREFQHLKHSTITQLKEKPQSLSEEGNRLWESIRGENFQFELRQVAIENIKHISKSQLIKFYQANFLQNSSKISLQLYGEGMVQQMMNIETQVEFNEFVENTKPKDSEIYNGENLSYYECEVEEVDV